jgi:hypothetical protein
MSADSGPSCSLLSGSDPVEAIEQENGVPVDDVLRPVNSTISARTASTRAIFRRRARIFQLAALAVREYDLHRRTARHLHLRIKKTGKGNHDPTVMTRNF